MNNVWFPPQLLSMARKNKTWREQCVNFADSKLHFNYSLVRQSVLHLKINYDLVAGKIHMDDLLLIYNPEGIKANFISDTLLHYDIIGSKLNVLKGEELGRVFDYKVIVTNPNAISEIEKAKKQALFLSLLQIILDTSINEELFNQQLEELNDYYTYEWLDFREVRGNCVLNHYTKEYNMPLLFNSGFSDALTVGEEIYQCDIVGGEPVIERLNPMKVRIFMSGFEKEIEKADMIVLEDYWSLGRIYDTYYDVLKQKDLKTLESYIEKASSGAVDSMDNIDERFGFVNANMMSDVIADSTMFFDPFGEYSNTVAHELLPYDLNGNIRVMRVYWKSRKRIKKIKFYDPVSGEEDFTFMPETYIPNEMKGEEEQSFWVNEAWEGTKIGLDIYVNIKPRVIQYNRLDSPSRCHFGIVGNIYNINDDKPFSLVDSMKPFNYLYDIIHDRLNKMIARNWGKMARLDLAKKPKSWKMEKWLYYAKTMGLFVEDSFNEGEIGRATGVMAGSMNSNTLGVIDADFGNNILLYINLLEFIKMEMADVAGISKQREGQIANRETVGGVERATLLSSHITERLFAIHDDVKRRALECFLETAKIAMRGRTKKFNYILPDNSRQIIEIDGEEFAECDYGLIVDNSRGTQELLQELKTLAQAALQTQTLTFSTIMKLFMSASIAEKQRFVERDELRIRQQLQQQQLAALLQQQQTLEAQMQDKQAEREFKDAINLRDNETKVVVAEINSQAEMAILLIKNRMTEMDKEENDGVVPDEYSQEAKDKLMLDMIKFDKKLALDKERLEFDKLRSKEDLEIKRMKAKSSKK